MSGAERINVSMCILNCNGWPWSLRCCGARVSRHHVRFAALIYWLSSRLRTRWHTEKALGPRVQACNILEESVKYSKAMCALFVRSSSLCVVAGVISLCLAFAVDLALCAPDQAEQQAGPFSTKDLSWLIWSAEQGHVSSQVDLGGEHESGENLPQDYAEAVKWYRKAALQGNADGQYSLGTMYESGHGVEIDYTEAVKWYTKAANQGDAMAQFRLGVAYSKGRLVKQDFAEAARWYAKAAEQGDLEAQSELGFMYSSGKGIKQDAFEAVKWFRKAAEQGGAVAQSNLGVMYSKGEGVPQDYVFAYMWFELAATNRYRVGMAQRDFIATKMTAEQITQGQQMVQDWKREH